MMIEMLGGPMDGVRREVQDDARELRFPSMESPWMGPTPDPAASLSMRIHVYRCESIEPNSNGLVLFTYRGVKS